MSNLPLLAFQHHVGQLFIDPGEIEFVCSLGDGELALVEKGRWHTQSGVLPVVVKGYKPFVVGSPEDFREMLLEASKLHRQRHPNITRFLGLGCFSHGRLAEVRESMFMVEEYVGTRTLRKVVGEQMRCRLKNLYDMQTALRWAAELAAALEALHEQQPPYIHGDVKADNAFLSDSDDLASAEVKLGDLKPHRHVYDREPSTLSQHQQHAAIGNLKRQGSLEQLSLERSSMGSSTSWASANVVNGHGHVTSKTQQAGGWISKKQQQQEERQRVAGAVEQSKQQPIPLRCSSIDKTTADAGGVWTPPAARAFSLPLPIAAESTTLSAAAASCPSIWDNTMVLDASAGGDAYCWRSANRSSSLPEQLDGIGVPGVSRSLPITSCLSASEMTDVSAPVAAASAVDMKRSGDQQQRREGEVTAGDSSSSSWRRNRTTMLSDSASSTNGGSGGSGPGNAVGSVSLADAELDEETMDTVDQPLLHQVVAADQESLSCKGGAAVLQEAAATSEQLGDLQDTLDCTAHAGHRQRSKSDMSDFLQEPAGSELQLVGLPLTTAKSAPATVYRGCLQDEKVHCGSLKELGLLQVAALAVPAQDDYVGLPQPPQKHKVAAAGLRKQRRAAVPEHSLLAESGLDTVCRKQRGQQFGQAGAAHGWELSPSGAASPCGAVHTVMLDLFADLADDAPISRRARDQYTLAPGSFVQQRVTSPAAATATALKSSISWDPAFNGTSTSSSQGLMSAAQQQQQPSPQQQPGLERPCISKAGAPSAFESKQHGGNSAFAALTAIDCITEETSSIATESVRGSLPPSRENTAHGGGHYYRDSPVSANSHKDQDSSSGSHKGLAKAARGLGLTLLLTRSLGSSNGGLDSHGSGEGLYGTNTPKAAAAIGNTGSIGSSQLMQQLSLEQALSGSPSSAACECSSSPYPCLGAEGPAALATVGSGPAKKVRFNMERPAGSTPSRDYGLLYTAPELLSGQRPTEKVDVFAFGVLLYELLSRSLLVAHCAAAVGHNRSRKGNSPHSKDRSTQYSPRSLHGDYVDVEELPEQQLLLAYAQLVANGYRPPFPGHFPEPVQQLISGCWAAEPHERPRMGDVLSQLQALAIDRQVVGTLNNYLAGLADLGYADPSPECGCRCVIS